METQQVIKQEQLPVMALKRKCQLWKNQSQQCGKPATVRWEFSSWWANTCTYVCEECDRVIASGKVEINRVKLPTDRYAGVSQEFESTVSELMLDCKTESA